jgi:hypothetical protein
MRASGFAQHGAVLVRTVQRPLFVHLPRCQATDERF